MEKKYLIQFLRKKKKGAYSLLVKTYSELVTTIPIVMALEIIREDLQKDSKEPIVLNYFSLARAIARFKKKNPVATKGKFEFKDAYELDNIQSRPGKFKLS